MQAGRRRLLGTLVLVTVAVTGLSMHGLDGAVVMFGEPAHSTHNQSQDPTQHDPLGLCVFVAAMAGLGFGAVRFARGANIAAPVFPRTDGPVRRQTRPSGPGPSRLVHLCVLRL